MHRSCTRILRAVQRGQGEQLRGTIKSNALQSSRSLHSTGTVWFPAKFYKDPTYRRDLYYHPEGSDRYALSFLSKQGSLPDEAIIGWTKVGLKDEAVLTSTAFQENESESKCRQRQNRLIGEFNALLHQVIRENYMQDESLHSQAQYQRDGFIHIGGKLLQTRLVCGGSRLDERNPPFAGRIPDVEDIIGSVQINDGKVQPDTYQPNPSHRILSLNGVFILTDHLMKKLKERLSTL